MKRNKKYYISIILCIIAIFFSCLGVVLWSFYLPIPIIESGIAYYTPNGEMYNLYLFPYGVFLGNVAQAMLTIFVNVVIFSTTSITLLYLLYGTIEYIDIYVLRACGSITLYQNDRVYDDKSLHSWKKWISESYKSNKLDTWILEEMEYIVNKFKIYSQEGLIGNHLTKNLPRHPMFERHKFKIVVISIVVALIVIALCLPVGISETLTTAW